MKQANAITTAGWAVRLRLAFINAAPDLIILTAIGAAELVYGHDKGWEGL
jgi:hypothetical protein